MVANLPSILRNESVAFALVTYIDGVGTRQGQSDTLHIPVRAAATHADKMQLAPRSYLSRSPTYILYIHCFPIILSVCCAERHFPTSH